VLIELGYPRIKKLDMTRDVESRGGFLGVNRAECRYRGTQVRFGFYLYWAMTNTEIQIKLSGCLV